MVAELLARLSQALAACDRSANAAFDRLDHPRCFRDLPRGTKTTPFASAITLSRGLTLFSGNSGRLDDLCPALTFRAHVVGVFLGGAAEHD